MGEGFFNKFKMLIGVEEVEDEEEEIIETSAVKARTQKAAVNDSRSFTIPERSRTFTPPKMESHESKVLSMPGTSASAPRQQFKLVVTEPKSFDECPKLADVLKNRKPVIINLGNIDGESAHKIFDFLSGVIYALNGSVSKVSNNIFVFAPESVDVLSGGENGEKASLSMASPWHR